MLGRLLNFDDICWWIIDLEEDKNSYYCNERMVTTFNLDPTLQRHSVSKTCPIAGDYLKYVNLKSTAKAELILREYRQLIDGEIEEYKNRFPYFIESEQRTYHFLSRARVLSKDSNGRAKVIYGIIEDVTREEELNRELIIQRQQYKMLSEIDHLTEVYNRRHFMQLYEYEFQRSQRTRSNIAVMMLDIDHFKKYNDHYGHVAGDECIRRVADCIRRVQTRKTDIVARYGGEEFILFLNDADSQDLQILADKIRDSVNGERIPHAASPLGNIVTISQGGVVDVPQFNSSSAYDFIEVADNNLYQAKRNGRDCYTISPLYN